MPTIETPDGTTIFYRDWGQGRPVVLIHGWPLSSDMWEYQSLALVEAGFRVVAPDRRGFGRSSQPWTGYDYDTMAADVAQLIEHLELADAVVAGFSMGGGEVARLAASGNLRIARIALVASVAPFLLRTDDNPDGVDGNTFDGMARGIRDDRPSFFAGFWRNFFGSTLLGGLAVPEPVAHWCQAMALVASPRATTACVEAFGRTDFRADLRRCRLPALVIHGTGDATVPIGISAHAATRLLRQADAIDYDGAPHGLFFTERRRLADDLIAFARAR